MGDFRGYLLKAIETGDIFPDEYIKLETWDSTPNSREEIKAYRDENSRDLTRVTAAGKKSSFKFTTRNKLHLSQKKEIQEFFTNAESDHTQRKVELEFWNDEDNEYKTGYFYRPDMNFPIYKITDDDILYRELTIECVEY